MAWREVRRRRVLQAAVALTTIGPFMARSRSAGAAEARLLARPATPSRDPLGPGLHDLGLDGARDGKLHVPHGLDPARPAPLIIMLHGAGGTADQVVPMLAAAGEESGSVVLAPDSRARRSWDVIHGGYGPDILFIDRALQHVFSHVAIDPGRLAIAGFSDGGSYALSVGLSNGDLFSDILAFSPGFAAPAAIIGRPRIFISHGTRDEILPIDRCGRRLSRELARSGYDVDYREFAGGHVVPPELVDAAVDRFMALA
jgi:phospholipase/carboxylesterase